MSQSLKVSLIIILFIPIYTKSEILDFDFRLPDYTTSSVNKNLFNYIDTIANWQLYLNDSLLLADNISGHNTINDLIKINLNQLTQVDKLIIKYHTCTWYSRMKKLTLTDTNGRDILKIEIDDENGDSPFFIDYSKLKTLQGKGDIIIKYNEYGTSNFWIERNNGKTGYIYPGLLLGKIKIV